MKEGDDSESIVVVQESDDGESIVVVPENALMIKKIVEQEGADDKKNRRARRR